MMDYSEIDPIVFVLGSLIFIAPLASRIWVWSSSSSGPVEEPAPTSSSTSDTSSATTSPSASIHPADKDAAIKTRIITHMNADHAESLSLFAQHYCKLPVSQASSARITDIELDHLILSTRTSFTHSNRNVARNYVPIAPAMGALAEARTRMVAMHGEALAGLGLSDTAVGEYRLPRSWNWLVLALTSVSFVSFARQANFYPHTGGLIYKFWDTLGLIGVCRLLQPYVITFMVVVHAAEAVHMARGRLRKHSVQFGSGVWYLWTTSCFLEGFGAFLRFDALVRDKEEEKRQKKH